MARKIRIQYPGATYHIMSRGDHYEDIFLGEKDRKIFLKTLGESCEKTGWIIHAYVLMKNHYHWLLETPEPNLVDGMQWFQSTYTKRFNSCHKLVGHVFQGRYRALIIDPDDYDHFQFVSNYIHLNPARAGLLDKKDPNLDQYPWSSYPYFIRPPGKRPVWLDVEKTFRSLNIFRDNTAGRKNYAHYIKLALIEVLDPKKLEVFEKKWNKIRRGWYLGDDTFKEKMLKQAKKVLQGKKDSSYYGSLMREHSEKSAEELILRALDLLGIRESDFHTMKKNDPYKQAVAWILKTQTVMKNQWIADQLHMGHWTSITKAVKNVRETKDREIKRLKKKLENIL